MYSVGHRCHFCVECSCLWPCSSVCMNRYDHNTIPLAFSSHSTNYSAIFSASASSPDDPGVYTPSLLPRCSNCQAPRIYEYQLMPYLVTLLNRSARMPTCNLGNGPEDGLDWAIVMIFTCSTECTDYENEAWQEEHISVEWEE